MQNFFKVLFFTGIFPIILSVSFKYDLIQEAKSWDDAKAYCQANHTVLAIIPSIDDLPKLESVAQSQLFTSEAWIGMYDDVNSWRWSYLNIPLESFTLWDSKDPKNEKGIENCAVTEMGKWFDKPCSEPHEVVCFDENNNMNPYISVKTPMSWQSAQNYCRQHHTDLASVRNATESGKLQELLGSGKTWFGLFRDSWKWVDQTEVSSFIWKDKQPDNHAKDENCGFIKGREAEDKPCSTPMPFFCYSVFSNGKKQTMRLRIQSKQDGNDPDVQMSIMKKIKDKLKELGIAESATVTWSKRPDGRVFSKEKENN